MVYNIGYKGSIIYLVSESPAASAHQAPPTVSVDKGFRTV